MEVNLVGQSYESDSLPAGSQRTVNLIPIKQWPNRDLTGWVFEDAPGLVLFSDNPTTSNPQ